MRLARADQRGSSARDLSGQDGIDIVSQLALVFDKGPIISVGFVLGRDYVLLKNR